MIPDIEYEEKVFKIQSGDTLLMFTDGATEITSGGKPDQLNNVEGLEKILVELGYPKSGVTLADVETQLLTDSDRVRFGDDLTFVEIRIV